ncbi:MAG: hypothetical protein ACMXYK_02910 [Candidatus Woesearchaeota archaeon]
MELLDCAWICFVISFSMLLIAFYLYEPPKSTIDSELGYFETTGEIIASRKIDSGYMLTIKGTCTRSVLSFMNASGRVSIKAHSFNDLLILNEITFINNPE